MTILSSSFTHTVPNLYELFCLNIKDDILENVGNQTVAGPQCVEKKTWMVQFRFPPHSLYSWYVPPIY